MRSYKPTDDGCETILTEAMPSRPASSRMCLNRLAPNPVPWAASATNIKSSSGSPFVIRLWEREHLAIMFSQHDIIPRNLVGG